VRSELTVNLFFRRKYHYYKFNIFLPLCIITR
jgi:hypothetical protein